MVRSVNKSGPPRCSPAGRHSPKASGPPTPREGESGSESGAGTQRTVSGTPRPDQSLSARPQDAALNAPSQISRGCRTQCVDPRTLLPVCPAASSARIVKVSAQAASPKPQAWMYLSQGRRHTHRDTHALPEVDKYRPTNTKCHRGCKSALTSCCREDRMPTPGHCHFHLAPGTWAPLARLPPYGSCVSPLASPRQLPTSQVCEHENNTSKAPSGGARTRRSPSVRETGVGTCPSWAE